MENNNFQVGMSLPSLSRSLATCYLDWKEAFRMSFPPRLGWSSSHRCITCSPTHEAQGEKMHYSFDFVAISSSFPNRSASQMPTFSFAASRSTRHYWLGISLSQALGAPSGSPILISASRQDIKQTSETSRQASKAKTQGDGLDGR